MAKSRQAKRRRGGRFQSGTTKQTSEREEETMTADAEVPENLHISASSAEKRQRRDLDDTDDNAQEETLPNVNAEIVFQCASCRAILGDTLSEYQAHFEFEALSLKAASNVSVQKDIHISQKGFDSGCTYRKIVCSSCGSHLGRTYTSTTVELDSLRSVYTFMHKALISYQLGSSKTMEGDYAPNTERNGKDREQPLTAVPNQVSPEAFDALDAHVDTLTDTTNKLTEAFNERADSITETKQAVEAANEGLVELRAAVGHVQSMILLWDERFQRLEACEQGLAKLATDCGRYDLFEHRMTQLEEVIRNSNFARARDPTDCAQTTSVRMLPSLRKRSSSPAGSLKRRR